MSGVNWWGWLPAWAQRFLAAIGSWGTEILFGFLLTVVLYLLAGLVLHGAAARLAAAAVGDAVLSPFYEYVLDPNSGLPTHRPMADIGQRACGQVLGLLLCAALALR